MQDMRERVLDFVKKEGPVLPVQISKILGSNILFAGAVLSELVSKKLIKITVAKIGGSPLYYVSGQEGKLSRLYDHLPGKEKEAYSLLKEKKVLVDTAIQPPIRFALRQLKDFAVPINVNGVWVWKWYLLPEEEIDKLLRTSKPKIQKTEPVQEVKLMKEDNFMATVDRYLNLNSIEIIEKEIIRKKSEVAMHVKVPSNLGILEFFLIAKDKKTINEADLSLAHNKGQKNKLPVLFLTRGKLTKKAEKYLKENLRGYFVLKHIEN